MRKFFTLFLFIFAFFHVASAQRLFTEDFNYNVGQLTSLNGGSNVSGGRWKTASGTRKPIQVVAGNLSFPGYTTSPSGQSEHLLLDTGNRAERAYVSFNIVQNNTAYVSFLLKVNSTNALLSQNSA